MGVFDTFNYKLTECLRGIFFKFNVYVYPTTFIYLNTVPLTILKHYIKTRAKKLSSSTEYEKLSITFKILQQNFIVL